MKTARRSRERNSVSSIVGRTEMFQVDAGDGVKLDG
jgi:hypothetical protein